MTKRLAAAACLALLACATLYAQQQQQPPPARWEKFSHPDGRFSVLLPGKPAEDTNTQQSPHGPYTVHLFTARGQGEAFLVGWVDYDPSFKFDTQAELAANRDKFAESAKAKVLTSDPIRLGAHPGIEFTAETDQAFFRSRVYVVGRRPYQLIALRRKGTEESPNFAKFFSSFEVTAAPAR